jgi:16S rRNA (cytosine1402-N4)-methyltransferase
MTHVAVLEPAVEYFGDTPGRRLCRCYLGAGGHSRAILSRLTSGAVDCLDADPGGGRVCLGDFDPHLSLVHANFRDLNDVLDGCGVAAVDGVLFDFGVSSMQLDDP